METSFGFEKYQEAITSEAIKLIEQLVEEKSSELNGAFANLWFDLERPTAIEREKMREEKFISKLFYGFSEINDSYENLLDISFYIRRFPYNGTRVSRIRYLRHNVEAFLNEVYILKERLISYARVIERAYSGTIHEQKVKNKLKPLYKIATGTLKDVVKIRGSHVHVSRFTDRGFSKLSLLEIVSMCSELPQFNNYFMREYRKERKRWSKIINKSVNIIKIILDAYFSRIHTVVLDYNDKVIYPFRN